MPAKIKQIYKLAILFVIAAAAAAGGVFAATTVTQNTNVTVSSLLSIEFASPADSTFGSGTIPWVNVDTSSEGIMPPTGHVGAKPDSAVICKSNVGTQWYLKLEMTTDTLNNYILRIIPEGSIINRNTGLPADGTNRASVWGFVYPPGAPSGVKTVYSSGPGDTVNTPYGTFAGVNYSLLIAPGFQLQPGISYTATITYTITTSP